MMLIVVCKVTLCSPICTQHTLKHSISCTHFMSTQLHFAGWIISRFLRANKDCSPHGIIDVAKHLYATRMNLDATSLRNMIYMPNSCARLIMQLVFPPCLSYNHSCAQCYILADYVDSRQRFGVSTLDRSRGLAERSRRWQAKGAVWNFRFPGRCFIHKCTKTLYSNGFYFYWGKK